VLTLEFDKNQSIDIKKLRNSSANDEGRALAARWRAKMCHGGFNTAVSHLLISGWNSLPVWMVMDLSSKNLKSKSDSRVSPKPKTRTDF
jgi:hypothetical protein